MNDNPAFIQALQNLGMTKTEAEVYLATLQTSVEGPVSGYKVAQVMGRDPANLSKTLAHLVKAGAVRLIQDKPRHYIGVPVGDFTEILLARMEDSREKAITLMASLGNTATAQQPTPLAHAPHILAQARRILSQSRGHVVLCCDGKTLSQLEEFLEDLGGNFPDLALVISESPREISGINFIAYEEPFPMKTGFADNHTENWLLVAANNGQWMSAFYNLDEPAEYTSGWMGNNHEISNPIKGVLGLLLGKTNIVNNSESSEIQEPPIQETNTELEDSRLNEKLDEIEHAFEAGAVASTAGISTGSDDLPVPNVNRENTSPRQSNVSSGNEDETVSKEPTAEEGFKFLVQHEEDPGEEPLEGESKE